jgi:putative Mg2+ transporter-C (MgtC) family protein
MEFEIALRAVAGLLAGGVVGLERNYHGRAAGVRTYALVCFGAALLVAAVTRSSSLELSDIATISSDVSRVVQGIMTGVGFLGAGVIVKEGFTVRGLTTAAAIWVISAIGVLIGLGYFGAASIATVMTFLTLSLVRAIETRMPSRSYVHCHIGFARERVMDEAAVRQLVQDINFTIAEISYRFDADTGRFEYHLILWTKHKTALSELASQLAALPAVVHFSLSPSER